MRAAEWKSDALVFEVLHHAAGRVESERAAAGEHDRVNLLNDVDRIEQIGLAGGWGRAAHVDAGGGAGFRENHGAAGGACRERLMADLDAGDGRQCRVRVHRVLPGSLVACARQEIVGVQAFRPAVLRRPEGLHYISGRFFHEPLGNAERRYRNQDQRAHDHHSHTSCSVRYCTHW